MTGGITRRQLWPAEIPGADHENLQVLNLQSEQCGVPERRQITRCKSRIS